MTQQTEHRSARALVLTALGVLLLALGAAGPAAAAAKPCGDRVINDWYDNGRVDGEYKLYCYDDAIESLPRDIAVYSSAKEDIQRALTARLNNRPAPPATSDPTPGGSATVETTSTDTGPTETAGGPGKTPPKPPDDGTGTVAGPSVETESADSVPLPLLVLGGLALLLIAAGSAGYLNRRLQARRLPPPAA